jgi:hypothetical protein
MKKQILSSMSLSLWLCVATFAQQPEDNSRRFWPPEFRPQASAPNAKPRTGRYKTVTAKRPQTLLNEQAATLGVTLWVMRTAAEIKAASGSRAFGQSDELVRVLIKKKVGTVERTEEMIPQRVEANTLLKPGELVRLSVEVPQDGYLYVIDREKYADGKLSAPYLVYPSNPQGKTHAVKAGRTIELPDSESVFEISAYSSENNARLAGELLSFVITPRPLEGLPRANADESPIQLTQAQVEAWEAQWGKSLQVQQLELVTGAGKARTKSEQQALTVTDQSLKQDDPLPQTVFQVSVKRGSPFIVQLPLRVRR